MGLNTATSQTSTTSAASRAGRFPAVTLVSVYVVLLVGIPSKLIVRQIGAAGTPATLWGLFLLLWWVCATVGGLNPRGRSPVRVAVGVLGVGVLLSYAVAMTRGWYAPADVRQSTDDVYDLVPATVQQVRTAMILAADRGLLAFGAWLGVALITTDGVRNWRDLSRLITVLTTIGGIVGGIGALQYFVGIDISSWFRIPGLAVQYDFGSVGQRSVVRRVYATANHPIEFGVVMGGLLPLALHRTVFSSRSLGAWLCTASIAFGVAISISRSAIVVAGVGLAVLFIGWPPAWRRRFLAALPMTAIAIRLVAPGVVGTIRSLFTNLGNDPSVSGRTDDYEVIMRTYSESPIFGRGLFTFVPRYYRILDNQFLMILVELGGIGFVSFMALGAASFFSALRARRAAEARCERHMALALSASIAGVIVSYATFDAWGFPMAGGLTFVLFGMCGAAWNVSRSGASRMASSG